MTDVRSAIIVEQPMPHPPEAVWRMLTDPARLARWLMPNDFEPVLGHRFTFKVKPMGAWDGVVHCEVLEITPPHRLRYSWIGGAVSNAQYGARLDTIVTWTLTPVAGGTLLRMEHAGFTPENGFAFDAMSGGWRRIVARVGELLAEET